LKPAINAEPNGLASDSALQEASLSSALVTVFRGKFCDILLRGRNATTFRKDEVLYDVGAKERTFFFIRRGFVKVGTVTQDGREIIYDIRKDGDVAGELCASHPVRRDRAVALEASDVVVVPYQEIVGVLQKNPDLLSKLVEIFCDCLADAYEQINALAFHDTVRRLINVLLGLASRIGHRDGDSVQIPIYLTQEEIAQMVAARRERVSTALNFLRRRGMVQYSHRGHLLLRVEALEKYTA
jgi:CRP/FNR family cyclic AMP-dependent transcriptional regulator